MKICPNCKASNFDINSICESCGSPLKASHAQTDVMFHGNNASSENLHNANKRSSENKGIFVATSLFMILSCIACVNVTLTFCVFWIASLIYNQSLYAIVYLIFPSLYLLFTVIVIWMTGRYRYRRANSKPISIAFKVCTLLFVSQIAGILMLCDDNC